MNSSRYSEVTAKHVARNADLQPIDKMSSTSNRKFTIKELVEEHQRFKACPQAYKGASYLHEGLEDIISRLEKLDYLEAKMRQFEDVERFLNMLGVKTRRSTVTQNGETTYQLEHEMLGRFTGDQDGSVSFVFNDHGRFKEIKTYLIVGD